MVVPADLETVCVDLDGDESEFWAPFEADGRWGTPLYYLAHLTALPHRLRNTLDAIADAPPGGVLFHCAAGWDRTGLVAAVLLRAVGTESVAATADYMESFHNAERIAALQGRPSERSEREEVLARYGHSPESGFQDTFDALDVEVWFEMAAVRESTRAAIRTWRGALPVDSSASDP